MWVYTTVMENITKIKSVDHNSDSYLLKSIKESVIISIMENTYTAQFLIFILNLKLILTYVYLPIYKFGLSACLYQIKVKTADFFCSNWQEDSELVKTENLLK